MIELCESGNNTCIWPQYFFKGWSVTGKTKHLACLDGPISKSLNKTRFSS